MRIFVMAPLACLALVAGCAAADRQAESVETEQKLQRETDQRLRALEQSVSVLDTRVAQLNNRVYEVRTSKGRKTGMTVVPMLPEQPATAPTPAASGQQVALTTHGPAAQASPPAAQAAATPPKGQAAPSAPHARAIDPASPPQSPAAVPQARRAPAPATPAQTPKTSAPAPQAASAPANAPAALGLPPESASAPAVPAAPAVNAAPAAPAADSAAAAAVPVPAVSGSDLALPPEKPGLGLPPAAAGPQAAGNGQGHVAASAPPAPAAVAAPSAQATPQPATPRRGGKGEDAAYKEAVRPALAGRASESIPRFQSFLQQYPDGRYAANAEYWIGEGYYSQGKYQEALAQFEKVNARYPRHHKNADALLKTAMTRSRMGDKAGAAEAYKQLLAQFPNSEAAQRARARGAAR